MDDAARQVQERALRDALKTNLERCTEEQRGRFHRIFGEEVGVDQLEDAYDLVQRTVTKNLAAPTETTGGDDA
jgi:hypothetical protein